MGVRHPGHYGSWLHLVANLTTSSNINLYDWIGDTTQSLYTHRWTKDSKKLNAIITIPVANTINSTRADIPAIKIDGRFRSFDRITLIINGVINGGYQNYCYSGGSSFTVPAANYNNGILISSEVTSVNVQLVGGGGGGGTGNEKGNGGGGGGGGGGAYVSGAVSVRPGTIISFTAGDYGRGGNTRGAMSIVNGGGGGDTTVSFTMPGGLGGSWSAGGGKGGNGGGSSTDCDGCASVDNSGGPGGSFFKGNGNENEPSVKTSGSQGGRGDRGAKDTSSGSGGGGGGSGSGARGGAGGLKDQDRGGSGSAPGGGGGGGGFNDREGGERNNSGGDGAVGSYSSTYSVTRLTGIGILIENFIGYLKIDSNGSGKVAGYPSIAGSPTEWGTKPTQIEAPKPATSNC